MRNSVDLVNIPDELIKIERRLDSQTRIAALFGFWRIRIYLCTILTGFILISQNSMAGTCFILISIIFDYLIMRSKAKILLQTQIKDLQEILHKGFYEFDTNREDCYKTVNEKKNITENNPANILRKAWISKLADLYLKKDYKIIDAGCKGGQIAAPLAEKDITVYGVDLNRSALKIFAKRCKGPCIQANILQLSFKPNSFNAALCTEVLEHLYNPKQGLKEIANLLKSNGIIILSTDNRNHLSALEVLNPIVFFERIIGLLFPKVLKHRNLVWKWGKHCKIYHTNFSRTEIISLVKQAQLEIVTCFSYSFFYGLHKIIGRLKPNIRQDDYLRIIFPIEKMLANIPIIKLLGDHWIMVLRKTQN